MQRSGEEFRGGNFLFLRRLQLPVSDVASASGQFSIITVSRCAGHATYDPDAEKAADEVPKVFQPRGLRPEAPVVWRDRVKHARRSAAGREWEARQQRPA